jgi:hypothetical protein
MNWKITGIFILLTLLLSCSRDSCPVSAGTTTSEIRNLSSFREIVLYDKINVILTPDTVQLIRVEAGANLLAGISTHVAEGTLTIQDNNGCKLLRTGASTANVYISTGQLQKISYYAAGNVSSTDTLRAGSFTVDCLYGSGSINLKLVADSASAIVRTENAVISLSGYGNYAYVYCEEAGSVNLFQFTSHAVYVESKTVRDIDVHVTGNLQANILYKGNVYYMGSPPMIQTQITNTGQLIHTP